MNNTEGVSTAALVDIVKYVNIDPVVKYLLDAERFGLETWEDVHEFMQYSANFLKPHIVTKTKEQLRAAVEAYKYQGSTELQR